MSPEEFVTILNIEGVGYALTEYFSTKNIWSIEGDGALRELALKCHEALSNLNNHIDEFYSDLEA